MAEGVLLVNAKKQIRIKFTNRKGKEVEMAVPHAELSDSLAKINQEKAEKLNGFKVEFEEEKGQPKKVRPVGESFLASSAPSPASNNPGNQGQSRHGQRNRNQQHGGQQSDRPQTHPQTNRTAGQNFQPAFHNPYNFVPAPPRDQVASELSDQPPVGQHVLHADRYTGSIRVKMTVKTPLLIPDAAKAIEEASEHKSFPMRIDANGQPLVPPTSIKGMLRAAYEAVTNSRMAVFPGHDDRLADRMPARDGLSLVPARVIDFKGNQQIELLPGNSGISAAGKPTQGDPMYAAWLPRYRQSDGTIAPYAIRYPNHDLPKHGDHVEVWLELWERTGPHPFDYWKVRKGVRSGESLGAQPPQGQPRGAHRPVANVPMISLNGHVCITNRNIDRKHDERVFFTNRNEPVLRPVTAELRQQWCELIANYQSIHEEECRTGMTGPPALNSSVWSRQVVGGHKERQLSTGTLCFAAFRDGQVTALYPVMISRRLFESSPLSLLPKSLLPAVSLPELSPADRVFGWVNQQGKGACKGNLRIGPVKCDTKDAIRNFGSPGKPLAILGQPQPQQARFYVANSPEGQSQPNGRTKDKVGYTTGKGLRGRKVYPHHHMFDEQEYRRTGDVRDNQNRSIQGWVEPNAKFTFDIHVTNLSRVELGALIWLLSLRENQFHRLGGGKPLGFGSVKLEIETENTRIHDGTAWKEYYASLDEPTLPTANHEDLVQAFKEAVVSAYRPAAKFESVPLIAAWLRMAAGHQDNLPTHYPRVSANPDAAGENFRWFTENEGDRKVCLGELVADPGLPF